MMLPLARAYKRNDIVLLDTHAEIVCVNKYGVEVGRALIDRADVAHVEQHRWRLHDGYVSSVDIEQKIAYLHRYILASEDGDAGDHIDGNTLNNRRDNLRITTYSLNNQNKRPIGISGHRGVSFDKKTQQWRAAVQVDRVSYNGNRYDRIEDAVAEAKQMRDRYMTHHNPLRDTK